MRGRFGVVLVRRGGVEVRGGDEGAFREENASDETERRGREARTGVCEIGANAFDATGYYRRRSRGCVDDAAARRAAV